MYLDENSSFESSRSRSPDRGGDAGSRRNSGMSGKLIVHFKCSKKCFNEILILFQVNE